MTNWVKLQQVLNGDLNLDNLPLAGLPDSNNVATSLPSPTDSNVANSSSSVDTNEARDEMIPSDESTDIDIDIGSLSLNSSGSGSEEAWAPTPSPTKATKMTGAQRFIKATKTIVKEVMSSASKAAPPKKRARSKGVHYVIDGHLPPGCNEIIQKEIKDSGGILQTRLSKNVRKFRSVCT